MFVLLNSIKIAVTAAKLKNKTMITKIYKVTCDYCGATLNHYIGRKPKKDELRNDGFVITATKVFCNERCINDWNHDMWKTRYLNLRQNGKIHNRE